MKFFVIFLLILSFNCEASGIPVLEYHQVTDDKPAGDTVISPARFKEQMDYLHDSGYQTLSIDELVSIMNRQTAMPEKAIVITFDDGFVSVLNATPVLQANKMKASFWIITSFLKIDPPKMKGQYLKIDQLKILAANPNFQIESHTVTHPSDVDNNLSTWVKDQPKNKNATEALIELDASKMMLEEIMGKRVDYIAWPSGYYNQTLLDIAKIAGYKATITIDEGVNFPGDDPFKIKRLFIDGNCDLAHFIKTLVIGATNKCTK